MSNASEDDIEYDEWVVEESDVVQESQQTVYEYSDISIENALVLNKQMRVYLNDLKDELERMIDMCEEKYTQNEQLLVEMRKTKNEPKRYTTYYFCGYPYFKDRKGGAPPQSAEYIRRTEKENEVFPIDLEKPGIWLSRDKIELIQGVKKQVVAYLLCQNRDKIRKTAGKRCANELSARIETESSTFQSMHLKELLKKVEGTDFEINWLSICMDALEERHSPNECMAMWFGYLQPTLNRSPWTPAEEDKLLNAANDFGEQNWAEIAKHVDNRSPYQCFVHYQTKFNKKNFQKYVRWTPEQDKDLLELVEKYRIGNIIPWTKIMEKTPGRTKPQVYNRYMFSLHPEINRAPFTVDEDCILMAAIKEYGCNYREFPTNLLPGRNMRQIRERYNNVLKHVNVREHWTEQHDIKLMELVEKYGTTEWVKISEILVSHTRTSCRQRYVTITKFLEKHPNKTVSDVPRRKRGFSTDVTTHNWRKTIIEQKIGDSLDESDDDDNENNRLRKKPLSRELYNKSFYEFFKHSFNFKFGDAPSGSDSLFENIQIACHILQAPTIPRRLDLYNQKFSCYVKLANLCQKVSLEPDLLKSLVQLGKNDFNYPINLNTILGLRGVVSMLELPHERNKNMDKKIDPLKMIKDEPAVIEEHKALNLFKLRFKTIFNQTATLAKMRRKVTCVSLRLSNNKKMRVVKTPKSPQEEQPIEIPSTITDFHNNETLVRVAAEDNEFECYTMSESEEIPKKRPRITVLESITLGLNETDPLSQPSTSSKTFSYYRYRVEPSDLVTEINIQPYVSESETENITDDQSSQSNTEFVIWTPTISDEATGSTTKQFKPVE